MRTGSRPEVIVFMKNCFVALDIWNGNAKVAQAGGG